MYKMKMRIHSFAKTGTKEPQHVCSRGGQIRIHKHTNTLQNGNSRTRSTSACSEEGRGDQHKYKYKDRNCRTTGRVLSRWPGGGRRAPREPLRGAAATERGFSAPSWDPFVAGTLAVLELGKVILMGCDTEAWAHSIRSSKTLFFSALDSASKFSQTLRSSPTWVRCPAHCHLIKLPEAKLSKWKSCNK